MLDESLILYIGLLALVVWRFLFMWRCCGVWLEYANYCVLMYVLLVVLLVYSVYEFVKDLIDPRGKKAFHDLPGWLRVAVIGAPICTCLSYVICLVQTLQHIAMIRKSSTTAARDSAALKHDRAVQIIALPGLYAIMAMASLMRMYQALADEFSPAVLGRLSSRELRLSELGELDLASLPTRNGLRDPAEADQYIVAKSENCFWVGDLYESWALYQFAKLTLELIRDSISKNKSSPVQKTRETAAALLNSHKAVESLAWVGVGLFLMVCSVQAGWSLYLLVFTNAQSGDWSKYNYRMAQFSAAGMVSSMGAIYGVHTVQHNFHEYLATYNPLMKFITVKVIVTFAFFQKGVIWCLRSFQSTLPGVTRAIIRKIPLLGDILNFSEVEFEVFYSSIITFECLLIALMHVWAWSPYEPWYADEDSLVGKDSTKEEAIDEERQPLLSDQENQQPGGAPAGSDGDQNSQQPDRAPAGDGIPAAATPNAQEASRDPVGSA